MNIQYKDTNTVPLSKVDVGGVFEYCGALYLRLRPDDFRLLPEIRDANPALNLSTNSLVFFGAGWDGGVRPCNYTLIVEH